MNYQKIKVLAVTSTFGTSTLARPKTLTPPPFGGLVADVWQKDVWHFQRLSGPNVLPPNIRDHRLFGLPIKSTLPSSLQPLCLHIRRHIVGDLIAIGLGEVASASCLCSFNQLDTFCTRPKLAPTSFLIIK